MKLSERISSAIKAGPMYTGRLRRWELEAEKLEAVTDATAELLTVLEAFEPELEEVVRHHILDVDIALADLDD